jgi:hypothetical protein
VKIAMLATALLLAGASSAEAELAPVQLKVRREIRDVFPKRHAQAVRVARCESHLWPWARNGQYLGVFQLSESWRSYFRRYGLLTGRRHIHGQVVAAHLIFRGSGYRWTRWECKP